MNRAELAGMVDGMEKVAISTGLIERTISKSKASPQRLMEFSKRQKIVGKTLKRVGRATDGLYGKSGKQMPLARQAIKRDTAASAAKWKAKEMLQGKS
jgi:hypothetical protein